MDGSKNNPERSSTTNVGELILSGFSMSTITSFKDINNKHGVYKGKNYMKIFYERLKNHARFSQWIQL